MIGDEVDFVGGRYKGLSGNLAGCTAKRVKVSIVWDGNQKVVTVMNKSISKKCTV
jgi:ribosomal protein L21E